MDNSTIEELRNRISTEPSVLFLGQDYLSSRTGHNPFYDAANQKLCEGKLPSKVDYSELWHVINNGSALTSNNFAMMSQLLNEIPEQSWLRKILSMRWSMVITSAVDGAMFQCVGKNFVMTPVSMDQRLFNRSYITKRSLHVSTLYGTINGNEENHPPFECSKKAFTPIRKRVNDRLDWIYSDILADYGILIIDGWDPDRDWVTNLLDEAGEMPYNSIYLFGAAEDLREREEVESLQERGILQSDERTLAQALEEIGFFDELSEWDEQDSLNQYGRLITLETDRKVMQISVPFGALSRLDPHITVLYDDIWIGKNNSGIDLGNLYAQFQMQTDQPIWYLYSRKYEFYFERTQDKVLLDTVKKELHNDSYKRKYIMLEGNSNTGKTASLVHLAYILRTYAPVIYISGLPNQPEWMEQLKRFIKSEFVEKQDTGKRVDSVLVIWDANTDYNASQRCKQLQSVLRECNTVVVGSAYPLHWENKNSDHYKDAAGNHHLLLTAQLDNDEKKKMYESIKKINPNLFTRLNQSAKSDPYLLHLLQQIIHLEYSDEWKQVAATLQARFNQEVDSNENYTDIKLKEFKENMEKEVDEAIAKYGIASSWQLQLLQIKEKYFGIKEIESEKKEKIDRLEGIEKDIKQLNKILSVTGEFSVDIPLALILRMISNGKQRIFSDEHLFLMDIIQNDSLLRSVRDDAGYITVNFRHPSEAELYIDNNFGNDPDDRKLEEVNILKKMIRDCKWNDEMESLPVLALVRSFGPNSWGTLNHPRKTRHYTEYDKWWKEIALDLKNASDKQPEAILVYALLIRSSCRDRLNKLNSEHEKKDEKVELEKKDCIKELNDAKKELRNAIEIYDQNNKNQYCRLLGEMCANLVFGMVENQKIECENNFYQLKNYFSRAVKSWSDNNSQTLFTKNSLLDIWLNGVNNYFKVKFGGSAPSENLECAAIVADSIHYIGELLDLTEEGFDRASLLNKVDQMYQYAKNDHFKDFEMELEKSNNDTFLYLSAWRCWQISSEMQRSLEDTDEYIQTIAKSLYLIPDDLDRREDYKSQLMRLKEEAKRAAHNAIEVLEKKKRLIESSKSTRCISMLIRSKWLVYTGNMPLETKQQPLLNFDQWKEIGELCEKYIRFADGKGEQLHTTPIFLRMVYVWCFTKNKNEFQNLQNRQNMLTTNDWYFERICLCNLGTNIPKQFTINLQLKNGTNNKYVATIISSPDEKDNDRRDPVESNVRGKQVHVPIAIAQTLLGNEFGSEKYNIEQPMIVWFNAKGPQIGIQRQKGEK